MKAARTRNRRRTGDPNSPAALRRAGGWFYARCRSRVGVDVTPEQFANGWRSLCRFIAVSFGSLNWQRARDERLDERMGDAMTGVLDREVESIAAQRELEASAPMCRCGQGTTLCTDCGAWVCKAPGHALHVCEAFSQVTP